MRGLSRCVYGLVVMGFSTIAFGAGGNIAITGHDDDFHAAGCGSPTMASAQLSAMVSFARQGAPDPTKPVLSFDHGHLLTNCLTALGISFTNIDPDLGVPAASNFNVANFSAMVVASDSTCVGCDNTPTSITNLTGASTAIGTFLNAGGGIVALAGASNAATYYGFIPATASGFGSPPSSGYVQTPFGATVGIPAVNGNATHNFFNNPGTGGVSAAYGVAEVLSPANTAETLACQACTTGSLGGTPTPPASGAPALGGTALILTAMLLVGIVWYFHNRTVVS